MKARFAFAICAAWILSGSAVGQDLPKAEDLMDKYVEVTGGKEAREKLKNRVSKGTVELAGIKGKITIYQAAPNLMHTEMDMEGVGKFESGTDGTVVWEKNPITGPRLKTGVEKAATLRSALFNADVEWRKIYKQAKCTGEEKVGGQDCYKIELTPHEGDVITAFVNKHTGLTTKMITPVASPMGNVVTTSVVSDYRKVDGILLPHKMVTTVLTQEVVVTFTEQKHNVMLPENRFALPEEIKTLVDKK